MDVGLVDDPGMQWGPASSPVIFGNTVLVQNDRHKNSFLAAYDLATGKELWRTPHEEYPSWATPAIIRAGTRTEADEPFVDVLRRIMNEFRSPFVPGLPRFTGGAVGFIGYDASPIFEPALREAWQRAAWSGAGSGGGFLDFLEGSAGFGHRGGGLGRAGWWLRGRRRQWRRCGGRQRHLQRRAERLQRRPHPLLCRPSLPEHDR